MARETGWLVQEMRRSFSAVIRYVAVVLLAVLTSSVGTPAVRAAPAIVVDAQSGRVLFAHRAFDQWHPASVTKLMTAYVAFEAVRAGRVTLESPVTQSDYSITPPPSKMGFPVGTRITLWAALKIIMVKSANDISVAIGEAISGSEAAFVAEMNDAARRLGMTGTKFFNPHGLHHPQQVTTARDMAVLARALLRDHRRYAEIYGLGAIRVANRVMRTHNRLIGRYPGADGMKTGYICSAGYNLVASASRNGRQIIAVVLGARNGSERALVAAELLDMGFGSTGRLARLTGGRTRPFVDSYMGAGRAPHDMRPHICRPSSQRVPIPDHIASFGFTRREDQVVVQVRQPVVDPAGGRVEGVSGVRQAQSTLAELLAGPANFGPPVDANGMLPQLSSVGARLPEAAPLPPRRSQPGGLATEAVGQPVRQPVGSQQEVPLLAVQSPPNENAIRVRNPQTGAWSDIAPLPPVRVLRGSLN
jgi:D-alanyl-D-alanine carboxypeptidase